MLARSPNSRRAEGAGAKGTLLVAAISARALAQAARRAGWRVLAADFFGDDDTRAAADAWVRLPGSLRDGVDGAKASEALRRLVRDTSESDGNLPPPSLVPRFKEEGASEEPMALSPSLGGESPRDVFGSNAQLLRQPIDALILGSGFERMPAVVDTLASDFPLAGCGAEAIRRVKDPQWLARASAELGIPHPEIGFEPPGDADNWVAKTAGGAGGAHVAKAAGRTASAGRYFQRRVRGESVSALFVADSIGAHIVGFSRQWTAPAPGAPYRYGGAVRLPSMPAEVQARIGTWLDGLVRDARLVGLCSADFIRSGGRYTLIEINPRPGATLDIFDGDEAPLIDSHVRAVRGLPVRLPGFETSKASLVAYASAGIRSFPQLRWPDWTADRQSAGTRLGAGDPVCTVFGEGATAAGARRQAAARLRRLQRQWSSS